MLHLHVYFYKLIIEVIVVINNFRFSCKELLPTAGWKIYIRAFFFRGVITLWSPTQDIWIDNKKNQNKTAHVFLAEDRTVR